MEAPDPDQVFDEERLVLRGPFLIESDEWRVRFAAARRIEKIRSRVRIIQGVTLEGRFAMINHAAESERAAPEHRAFAPFLD